MQNDINLKAIVSVSILVLIIGFINTARIKEQAAAADRITAAIASDNPRTPPSIDSSFFNLDQTSGSPSTPSPYEQAQKLLQNLVSVVNPQPASTTEVQAPAPADIITADSYLVANLATGKVYFEKDPTAVRPIASISKLITAMVIEKNIDPDALIDIASSSVTGYEQAGDVHPGETFSASDLEKGMLLISSNDSALAFANYAGYPAFISLMNAAVQSLGMAQTSFKDPSGLSPGNVSSADDLFKLAKYLYGNEPGILSITKTPEFDLATTTAHDGHDFVNIDPFAYDPHYLGGKTGRSDAAGETMLSLFNLPIKGVDNPIAIIVLHSGQDARQTDSSILVGKVLGMISSQ